MQLLDISGDRIHQLRPEIIGSTFSTTPESDYVEPVYFTSEAEARDHEGWIFRPTSRQRSRR